MQTTFWIGINKETEELFVSVRDFCSATILCTLLPIDRLNYFQSKFIDN